MITLRDLCIAVRSVSRLASAAVLSAVLSQAALAGLSAGIGAVLASATAEAADATSAPGARAVPKSPPKKKAARMGETPFGHEGDPHKVKRVIHIEMSDAMRFFPDQIRIRKGQTVRFVIRNAGETPHELVLGTMDELKQHAGRMRRNEEVERDEPNRAYVEPGKSGRIVWQFTKAGEFYYGCLMPGHFEAGMIGTVVVR